MTPETPLPLTASLNPEKNIGVEKVLYTGRITEYPIGEKLEIARVSPPWTVEKEIKGIFINGRKNGRNYL